MAKNRTDTEAVIKLVIDGKQAQTSAKELGDTVRRLKTEVNNLKEVDDPENYKKKKEELHRVAEAWDKVKKEINGTTKEIVNSTRETREFNNQIQEISTNSQSFKSKIGDFVSDAIGGLSIGGAIYAAGAALKTLVTTNAELSDSYGRVQKTTGLTEEAVDRLNIKFKKMDTRTANAELLGLAEVAGKLGISAEKDVEGFVRAADKIGVALGEDLGGVEESINSLGKLTDIFKLKDTFGIEEALLKVGSAINTLGASGTAAEKNLVDFANRMAGVAPAAGITIDQVLGLGAVMDELGQSMESSSTAIGQFIIGMGADVPKFAKIAGMSIKDFSKLLKEDANGAMIAVLEKSKSAGGGVEALAKNMGLLEVSGAQGVKALSTLSENLVKCRSKQAESAKASAENTSILGEFNNMNTTLGANLDKIWNKIGQIWENSSFRNGMTKITAMIVDNRNEGDKLINSYDNQKRKTDELDSALTKLMPRYDSLKSKVSLNKDEQVELKEVLNNIAVLLPDAVTEWDKYGNAIDINREKVILLNNAQQKLMKDMNISTVKDGNSEIEKLQKSIEKDERALQFARQDQKYQFNRNLKDKVQSEDIDPLLQSIATKRDQIINLGKKIQDLGGEVNKIGRDYLIAFGEDKNSQSMYAYDASKVKNKKVEDTVVTPTGCAGDGDKNKSKLDAQKAIERINEDYKKILQSDKAFGAARLMDQLATNDKEIAQEAEKYRKQIEQWEEFKSKLSKGDARLLEADKQISELGQERDKSIADIKIRQEEVTTKKIEDLRSNLANKHATELEKERVRINQFYDELEKNAGTDTVAVAKIREEKQKELADAVIREEKRIKDETTKLKNETVDLDGDSFDKRIAKIKSAYAVEHEELKIKYANELGTKEAFYEAEKALKAKYDAQEAGVTAEKETKAAEKEKEKAKEKKEALLDVAQSTADAVFDIMANNRKAESDAILSGIEKQREKELSNKNLTEAQKQKINEKYDKQARAEKLRAWKAEKSAALTQSFINTALAVTKALPNVILAAVAGASGLAQSVVIASQKPPIFAQGGIIPNGPTHAQGGLNIVDRRNKLIANIEGGEPILSRSTYANNREIVDALLYSSQRKAGARIGLNPSLLDVEQSVRNGGRAMTTPVVNVDNSNSMDMDVLAQAVDRLVDNKIKNIEVSMNYHYLQDTNDKVVRIKNSVDA